MAAQGFFSEHWNDENENPAGGVTTGRGFTVSWQNGPLGKVGSDERREPNGAFVEDVINAVIDRLAFYQNSKFRCQENADAIARLEGARDILNVRTRRREKSGVEGTHAEDNVV